jgi:hypothetical protein
LGGLLLLACGTAHFDGSRCIAHARPARKCRRVRCGLARGIARFDSGLARRIPRFDSLTRRGVARERARWQRKLERGVARCNAHRCGNGRRSIGTQAREWADTTGSVSVAVCDRSLLGWSARRLRVHGCNGARGLHCQRLL